MRFRRGLYRTVEGNSTVSRRMTSAGQVFLQPLLDNLVGAHAFDDVRCLSNQCGQGEEVAHLIAAPESAAIKENGLSGMGLKDAAAAP